MAEVVHYNVGNGVAFVSAGRTLLLDEALGNEATEQLWAVVSGAETTHELIESLAAFGLRKLGDFALLFVDMERSHVIVRGDAIARVKLPSGLEELTAAGTVTWIERAYDNVVSVELSLGIPTTQTSLPFGSGVVHASRVRVRFGDGVEVEQVTAEAPQDEVDVMGEDQNGTEGEAEIEAAVFPPADDAGLTLVGVIEAALPENAPHEEQPVPFESSDESTFALDEIDQSPLAEEPTPQAATMWPPEGAQASGGSGEPEEDAFDDLFGATLFRAIEGAAIREAEELEGHADPSPIGPPTVPIVVARPEEPAFFPVAPAPLPPSAPLAPPPIRSDGLIDGVPGLAKPPAGPSEGMISATSSAPTPDVPAAPVGPEAEVSVSQDEADPESFTISRAKLDDLKRSAVGTPDESPRVHGVYCEQNHPNPPQATYCRLCGSVLGQLEPVTIPRPVLGVLRFSNGVEAELDGPIVIGRSPRAERVSSKELPQLITLPSPDQNISRNHLEIKLDGWHVLVVDLDSVNGTVVTNPGEAPVLLRSGEDVPIVVGSVVTIADEITFVYEVSG